MRRISPIALLLCSLCALPVAADTITVDLNGGADYETIQGGLDAAGDGDVVLVAFGTYTGLHNTELDFHGDRISLLSVHGPPHEAVINCEQLYRAFVFDDGEDSLAVVQGFRIVSGLADTGGAVLISGASPSFTNCTIESSTATDAGGGIAVLGGDPIFDSCMLSGNAAAEGAAIAVVGGSATLRGCAFSSNDADDDGGALLFTGSSGVVRACTFSGNEASDGGAAYVLGAQVDFDDCDFDGNEATRGGALSLRRPSVVSVSGCSFVGNRSDSYGAALHMYGCSPSISDCLFRENEPTGGGTVWGEYSSPVLSYCTFWNNRGTYEPDIGHDVEFYHTDIADALIENCTFCGWRMNSRDDGALLRFGDCEPLIERCIIAFYNHGPGITCAGTGEPTIRECVVYGNVGGDEICGDDPHNNMSLDPLVCGFWEGDMTLCANSPCLPEHNSWGALVGAHDLGCGECETPVEHASWGTIKAMFR